jgi:hypothetical protein
MGRSAISPSTGPGLNDNDLIGLRVRGYTATAYINGAVVSTRDLSSLGGFIPVAGAPGMGVWRRNNGVGTLNNSDMGLRSFMAVEEP